jgi:hypothetical protein
MHPAIAALTPQQADAFVGSPYFEEWLEDHGIPFDRSLLSDLFDRSLDPKEFAPEPHGRKDAGELRELVAKAARLPSRVRQVASLCLDHGLTLRQCAASSSHAPAAGASARRRRGTMRRRQRGRHSTR